MGEHVIGLIEWIELQYEWNELDVAERLASEALDSGRNWWNNDMLASASYLLGRVYRARGDLERGAQLMRQSRDLGRAYNVPQIAREIEVYEAADALADGQPRPAAMLVEERSLSYEDLPAPERFDEYELLARLLIAQQRAELALGLIGRLRIQAMEGDYTRRLIRIDILWALALHACGRTDEALAPLLLALTLAQPGQHIRLFVDEGQPMCELLEALRRRFRSVQATPALQGYVERLQRACAPTGAGHPAARPPAAELRGLTAREREVLALMASGASNQQIADQLVVTLHTVKKHVSSILAKLGVASRMQAAARWRGGSFEA
jgi:LuxR family maltose regulon positive regulatory protein